MELVNRNTIFIKSIIIAIFIIAASLISGCGGDGNYSLSNGADYIFAIKGNYTSQPDETPLEDVLKLSELEAELVSYTVEDSSILKINADGTISSCDCNDQRVTYIDATYGETSKRIKVVVAGDYSPETYKNFDNLYIPYGVDSVGKEYAGYSIKYLNISSSVKSIKDGAFKSCTNLKEAYLPASLKAIPVEAFKECINLKYVSIPESITLIADSAFRECESLVNVTLHEGIVTIDDFAFYSDGNLESINFPSTLAYIGERAFCNCTSLISVKIPESITKINNDTFSSCTNLKELSLSNTLETIGERAFLSCRGLEKLVIPDSVTSLGLDAFSGCINIKSITMPLTLPVDKSVFPSVASVEYFRFTGNGDGYDYTSGNYTNTPWYISRNHKLKVDVDEGVTAIGDYTFVYCYGLVEINLPNSLNKICHGAFRKCFNLENIVIPDNVTEIELHAFSLDYALKDITYSKNLCIIGNYAFFECSSLEKVNLPDTVTSIGAYAYSSCKHIASISIGETTRSNLKRIGTRAFAGFLFNCNEVSIKSSKVKYIASGAFGYIGDEKPVNTVGTLARNSNIFVTSSTVKNLFDADRNYNSNDTSILIR